GAGGPGGGGGPDPWTRRASWAASGPRGAPASAPRAPASPGGPRVAPRPRRDPSPTLAPSPAASPESPAAAVFASVGRPWSGCHTGSAPPRESPPPVAPGPPRVVHGLSPDGGLEPAGDGAEVVEDDARSDPAPGQLGRVRG